MAAVLKKKSGKSKAGRAGKSPAHKRYVANGTRLKNKVKRVLISSGRNAATAYATKYAVLTYLHSLPAWKKEGKKRPSTA